MCPMWPASGSMCTGTFETTWDTPNGPVRVWQDLPICHDGLCRGFEDY